MPKKKRKSSKRQTKEVPVEHELPGGFWRQIAAVLMIALAIFFVATWFGHGGNGSAAYFIPAFLVYLAVKIFRSENNRVAIPVYIASLLMVVWISGIAAIWGGGGLLGSWLNGLCMQVLDQAVVIFIYIILIFITTMFILQISPLTFFKGTRNLMRPGKKREESTSEDGKKLGQLEIKVNSGLAPSEAPAQSTPGKFQKIETKLPEKEPVKEPTALVAMSDPDWKMPSTDLLEKKQCRDGGRQRRPACHSVYNEATSRRQFVQDSRPRQGACAQPCRRQNPY